MMQLANAPNSSKIQTSTQNLSTISTENNAKPTKVKETHGMHSNSVTMKPPVKSSRKLATGKIVLTKHKKKDLNYSTNT